MTQAIVSIGRCLRCNYDLRGLTTHACPECGHPFDPEIPNTMRDEVLSPGPVARWGMSAPGWPETIVIAMVCAHIVWTARLPGIGEDWIEAVIAFALCVGRLTAF